MSDIMVVGGTFDRKGGKQSYFVSEIAKGLRCKSINGGYLREIKQFKSSICSTLIWMPNIDNVESKIIPNLKRENPTMLLVSSKRVIEKKRSEFELISRMLSVHANLMIRIDKIGENYKFSLLDPLGNAHVLDESLEVMIKILGERINYLQSLSRFRSISIGERVINYGDDVFINVVREYADKFTQLIQAIHPERFLGNASFRPRCSFGFPSARVDQNFILVSRRNVNKQMMNIDDFVLAKLSNDGGQVEYFGHKKPSVDTPVQVKLYQYYPNINYMIHGHVYVKNAPFTQHKIPCGYIEEFDEIVSVIPREVKQFAINLRGHGCLIASNELTFFAKQKLVARPILEI
jgi:hypothetical protein